MTSALRTWGRSHTFSATRLAQPRTVDELRRIVATSDRVRPIGTRHSFNDIGDTEGVLVSLGRMDGRVEVDEDARTAWVPAGMSYGELASALEPHALALENTGSLPHISVGGACAVGTHGSGDRNRVLSASVTGLRLVTAAGEERTLIGGEPDFEGTVVSLGALGVVVALRLRLVPDFDVRQDVYLGMPWDWLGDSSGLHDVFSSAYSVSAFARSWAADDVDQVWVKSVTATADPPPSRWGARLADHQTVPVGEASDATTQGAFGSWADRLPHTRRDRPLSTGAEIQSEYFVAREDAPAALAVLRGIGPRIDPALIVSELRSVAADNLWLSPAYGRDTVAIHFTWRLEPDRVRQAILLVEEALAPFGARPHWGKWFAMDSARLRSVTPRLADFADLRESADPRRRFHNRFLDRVLGVT